MRKISIAKKREYLKTKLKTDNRWATKALLLVFDKQTEDEKQMGSTNHSNKVGFTGVDAEFLTSLAKQYKSKRYLTIGQMRALKKIIHKYWKQVLSMCDERKLIGCMMHDNFLTSKKDRATALSYLV